MIRTKAYYAEQVLSELQNSLQGRDLKIDPREVFVRMDETVNQMAKDGFLENMRMGLTNSMGDQFVTTFEELTVTDVAYASSYIQLPANYADLPENQGIDQVYFMNNVTTKKKYFDPVIIISFRDVSAMRSNMASDNEGRITCYVKNNILYFVQKAINATYGKIGIRQVVRSSSDIDDNSPYPVPANLEKTLIDNLVNWFMDRKGRPASLTKDANNKATAQ